MSSTNNNKSPNKTYKVLTFPNLEQWISENQFLDKKFNDLVGSCSDEEFYHRCHQSNQPISQPKSTHISSHKKKNKKK